MSIIEQENNPTPPPILLVCEDPDNLAYLIEILGDFCNINVATDAEEAYALLGDQKLCQQLEAVVIDEDLDLNEGIELLGKANHVAPLAQRVFITESADAKSLIEAINRGRIFKFVLKPFSPEQMLEIVNQATALCRYLRHRDLLLEELNERHRELKYQMMQRLDDLSEVLHGLCLPPIRDCEVFAHEAGQNLPQMLNASAEMLQALEGNDKTMISALAHQVHTQALALNTSFESLIQDVRENKTPLPHIQTRLHKGKQ